MDLVFVKTPEEGIRKVKQEKVFAYVDNIITTGHLIGQKGYLNIKMAGEIQFVNAQSMGVRKDWPQLRDILQKAIDSIPDSDRNAIYNQWVPIIYERPMDYGLFWKIGVGCLIFICLIVYWNRRLKSEVRKKTAELVSKEERLKAIFSHRFQMTGLLSPDGKLLMANESVYKIAGVNFEEIEGKYLWELPHWSHSEKLQGQIKDCVKSAQKGNPVNIETTHLDSEGNIHYIDFSLTPARNENGEIIFIVPEGHDNTKRMQAEESLRISEERLTLALDSVSDAVWDWNIQSNEFYFSPRWYTMLGYEPYELPQEFETWTRLLHPDDVMYSEKTVLKSLESGKPFEIEFRMQTKDDQWKWILGRGRVVSWDDQGKPLRMIGTHFDLTERKQVEEELRQSHKMESIGTLAGGIAHDFNNILSIIVGNTELALDDLQDWNPSYNNLKEIKIASLRAKDVVRQLLSFSRKTEQKQKPLDLKTVTKESIKLIRASIPSSIEIHQDLPETVDTILADATQIHQVLINLCTNASHAMSGDGGLLEIILRSKILNKKTEKIPKDLSPGDYIELIVKDSGSGIDPKIYDRIFDPYFTTKDVGRGTGMGLAVVHGIVKNHKGQIYVDSEPGKGTKFTILFPTINEQPQQNIEETEAKSNPTGKETILFVDDEEALVDMARMILEKLGYTIQVSTNPVKALAIFEADPTLFDLVISDMTMPQMSGVKLSEKIRKIQNDIPIIICTGHSSLIDEEKAKDIGISAFAMKPITMSEIAKLIRNVLDR